MALFPFAETNFLINSALRKKDFMVSLVLLLLSDIIYNPLFCLWFTRRLRQIMSRFLLNGRVLLHVAAISYGHRVVAVFQARRRVKPFKGL
jgi:hypothetical protein